MQACDGVGWPQLLINQRTELEETITPQTGGKSCQSENVPLAQVITILNNGKTRLSSGLPATTKTLAPLDGKMPRPNNRNAAPCSRVSNLGLLKNASPDYMDAVLSSVDCFLWCFLPSAFFSGRKRRFQRMPLLSFPGNLILGAMEESLCRQVCDQHHMLLSPTACSLTNNSKNTHVLYAIKSRWEQSALPTCTLITTKHVRSPHKEGTETI